MSDPSLSDASAVAAVVGGDRDRYRELVERYADQVFAVAWCRLGDRDLAEEAAQEAFIKGYQKLSFLGRTETFGAWITAIARNVAINLGLRNRRELLKRERWAVEQYSSDRGTDKAEPERRESELLSESLAALPALHRECLVLFYLERQSVSEAAQRLGISTAAFKTRLHRARAVLRHQMEVRLVEALPGIRPSSGMLSAVMLALPAHKPALSLGSVTVAGVAKLLPGWFLPVALQMVGLLPALAFHVWLGRKEVANLQDTEGFRAINLRRFLLRTFVFVAVVMAIFGMLAHTMGLRTYFQIFAAVVGVMLAMSIRSRWIMRQPHILLAWLSTLILWIAFVGIGFWGWPFTAIFICQGLFFLILSATVNQVPLRMDWSLFLRAQQGLLSRAETQEPALSGTYTADQLWACARFLGARLLVEDWRRGAGFLRMKLAPVTPSQLYASFPMLWSGSSTLTLRENGEVEAHLGNRDRHSLGELSLDRAFIPSELEQTVAAAVVQALKAISEGQSERAEAALGQEPLETLFRVAPEHAFATLGRVWLLRIMGTLFLVAGVVSSSVRSLS